MNKLILVRGASGSGKSTFARALHEKTPNSVVFETDQMFVVNGEYKFDPRKLGWAHRTTQNRVRESLRLGQIVIVANTLTTRKEINEYIKIAEEVGVSVEVYRSNANFGNTHGVPSEKVEEMRRRLVDYPGETIINN